MSDELNVVLANLGITERELVENLIGASFFADFGVVESTDQTTVDVNHAIKPLVAGTQLEATLTKKVEVLWPSGTPLSIKWTIAKGDTVLLIGLKDYVATVDGLSPHPPDTTPSPGVHYTQETMKAIPLGAYRSGATHTIVADTDLVIDGGTKGAARVDDDVIIDSTTAPAFITYLGTLTPAWGGAAIHGKIAAGSTKVKVG